MPELKPILPVLKEKKRYLAYEIISEKKLDFNSVKKAIIAKNLEFIGQLGVAKSGTMVLEDWKNQKGILKVNNRYLNEARASLTLIKDINGATVIARCIGVSGILNKARKKYLL